MAYGDFKDLAKRTAADKVLRDQAFNIAKDPKYNGYQRRYFLIKRLQVVVLNLCLKMSVVWTCLCNN